MSVDAHEPWRVLTEAEAAVLEAFLETLIPSGADGLGAREAHVADYIDRALGEELRAESEYYRDGLHALDDYAMSAHGASVVTLDEAARIQVLTDVEGDVATGFGGIGGAAGFFQGLRELALQGMFGDPRHGGNADYVGWRLLGYPGVRMHVSAAEQAIGYVAVPVYGVGSE